MEIELRKRMRDHIEGLPDGAKERPSFEGFLLDLGLAVAGLWRSEWLDKLKRKAATSNASPAPSPVSAEPIASPVDSAEVDIEADRVEEYRVLPEKN